MPIVRCPKHDIPYSSENPRGCPACAREDTGGSQADLMRQLARSSRMLHRPDLEDDQAPPATTARDLLSAWPVTQPPRKPETPRTPLDRVVGFVRRRKLLSAGMAATFLLLLVLMTTTGGRFVPEPYPPEVGDSASVRPLPLSVNVSVSVAFTILGSRPPQTVPDQPGVQRHAYGSRLSIDAVNSRVYALRIGVPSHIWRGLRVGMPESNARGALAILGQTQQLQDPVSVSPRTVRGYQVYRSIEDVPRKVIGVSVRPPNGCFDVRVTLQPQITGILREGTRRYAALGEGNEDPVWVVTEILVVSRTIRGPESGPPLC